MRHSTKARISAPSVAASSLTPREQHALAQHRNAGIDRAARRPRARAAVSSRA